MDFLILDSFTDTPFTGNPAGVVFHDGRLTGAQMQRIAGELGLESAFLSPSHRPDAEYQVSYYTGAQRIPLCGHDTIAAAVALIHTGRLSAPGTVRLATDVGLLPVEVSEAGDVTMPQALPQYGPTVPAAGVAEVLDLPVSLLEDTGLPVQVVSTGTPFLFVPMTGRGPLNALRPDMDRLTAFLSSLSAPVAGLYAWTRETVSPEAAVHARCFCPAVGLPEDPVTGTASGALGAYLARYGCLPPDQEGVVAFTTEQGYEMRRPGGACVLVRSDRGEVTSVRVRGRAVLMAEGTLRAA